MPKIINKPDTIVFEESLKVSGMIWINASPNSDPTAKLIKINMYFRRTCSFIERVNTPTKEIKLTINTLKKA